MQKMINMFMHCMKHTSKTHEIGHAIIRIGLGVVFLVFGCGKIMSGQEYIMQIGSAMAMFGVGHYFFWGTIAALTELLGGISYIVGFCTRLFSIPLAFMMIVALHYHISKGDSFMVWSFAFTCLCMVVGMLIAGAGKISVDYWLTQNRH